MTRTKIPQKIEVSRGCDPMQQAGKAKMHSERKCNRIQRRTEQPAEVRIDS